MGLLDGITGQNGLFGLGGIGGLNQANTAQLQPLLGGMYNPQDLQHIQLKNMLLGAGLGLLQQKPSIAPITFGSTLGDGLAGGLQQAQAATDSYRQNALTAYGLKRQQMMDQIPMNQEARAAQMFPDQLAQANLGLQSAQQQAAALNGLSPMQRLNPQYASELAQGPKTEYGPIGMNTFGQPIMGWRQPPPPNQNTGAPGQVSQVDTSPKPMNTFLPPQTTVQPPSAPNSPATATNPDVVGTGKAAYNPVAFNALPPEAKNDVVAIGRNDAKLADVISARGGARGPWFNMVRSVFPNWNEEDYPAKQAFVKSANGDGQFAQKGVQFNTAINHMGELQDFRDQIEKAGYSSHNWNALNQPGNWLANQSGGTAQSNYNDLHDAGLTEVGKALKGQGVLDADSVLRQLSTVNMNMPSEQHLSEVQTKTAMVLGEKIQAMRNEYRSSMNGEEPPDGLLTPQAKTTLVNLGIDPNTFKIVIPAPQLLKMRQAGQLPSQLSAGQGAQIGTGNAPALTGKSSTGVSWSFQ